MTLLAVALAVSAQLVAGGTSATAATTCAPGSAQYLCNMHIENVQVFPGALDFSTKQGGALKLASTPNRSTFAINNRGGGEITLETTGSMCLTAPAGGTTVTQTACSPTEASQRFYLQRVPDTGQSMTIRRVSDGMCLANTSGSTAEWAPVSLRACSSSKWEAFNFLDSTQGGPVSTPLFTLVNDWNAAHTPTTTPSECPAGAVCYVHIENIQRSPNALNFSTKQGGALKLSTGANRSTFDVMPVGEGEVMLKLPGSDCLSAPAGKAVAQAQCSDIDPTQRFYMKRIPNAGDAMTIHRVSDGFCMANLSGSTNEWATIGLRACSGSPWEGFYVLDSSLGGPITTPIYSIIEQWENAHGYCPTGTNANVCDVSIVQASSGNRLVRNEPGNNLIRFRNQNLDTSKWKFRETADGFVQILDYQDKCLVLSGDKVVSSPCIGAPVERWYLQPANPDISWNRWIIRHAFRSNDFKADNRCLDVDNGVRASTALVYEAQVWDCRKNDDHQSNAQRFELHTKNASDSQRLWDLATANALYFCSIQAYSVANCDYQYVSTTSAVLGGFKIASQPKGNYTPGIITQMLTWTSTKTVTDTVGITHTTTAEYGVGTSVVEFSAKMSVSVALNYSKSWANTTTESDTLSVPVNPYQTAWLMRAQTYKAINGVFSINNNLGTVWTGKGSVTLPSGVGVDGVTSLVIACTTDSTSRVCQMNRPPGV